MNKLQELFKEGYGQESSKQSLALFQRKAVEQIQRCRTAKLGGHARYCEDGHLNGVWYNSCKHRFCPQCNQIRKEAWIQNTQRILLSCPHHHIVFTIASELNVLWRYNRALMMDLLFESVQTALKKFCRDEKYLGATPGYLMALHTWGRDLSLHPHIHVLISHGGLNEENKWVDPKRDILFPQKPVMLVFRGHYLSLLRKKLESGELIVPPDASPGEWLNRLKRLYGKEWVVHFSDRYDHAAGVAKYLGRYIKGGPFRLNQVVPFNEGQVRFQYRSHKTRRIERMLLDKRVFLKRMLEHAALPGKPTLRYGGLYVSSVRERLNQARAQMGQGEVAARIKIDCLEYLKKLGRLPFCSECGKLVFKRRPLDQVV